MLVASIFSFSLNVFYCMKDKSNVKGNFCCIYRRQCHYEFNTVFCEACIVFCAKPKEIDPIRLNFYRTNKYFDSTQIYD